MAKCKQLQVLAGIQATVLTVVFTPHFQLGIPIGSGGEGALLRVSRRIIYLKHIDRGHTSARLFYTVERESSSASYDVLNLFT